MKNRTLIFGALGLVALSAGMFQLMTFLTKGDFEAVGPFEATGTQSGDFSIVKPTCLSGERWDYPGVRLHVEGGGGVRITQAAAGNEVVIEVPSTCRGEKGPCDAITIDPKRCSTYDVVVEKTNNSYNKRKVWRGHLRLRCELEPGKLVAALGFEQCA